MVHVVCASTDSAIGTPVLVNALPKYVVSQPKRCTDLEFKVILVQGFLFSGYAEDCPVACSSRGKESRLVSVFKSVIDTLCLQMVQDIR